VSPTGSVIVMMVLLNEAWMWAAPLGTGARLRRRVLLDRSAIASAPLNHALANTDGSARPLARAGVGARALSTRWESDAVAKSTIRSDLAKTGDAGLHNAAQVAFDALATDQRTNTPQLSFRKVAHALLRANVCLLNNTGARGTANAVDMSQRNHYRLVARNVNASNASHVSPVLSLAAVCALGSSK